MSRQFDKKTNVFNANGRIGQIEYAIQAIKQSGPSLAFKYKSGIIFITEKRPGSKLMIQPENGEKVFKIDEHVFVIVSGLTADGNYLVDQLRQQAQDHRYMYDTPFPVE